MTLESGFLWIDKQPGMTSHDVVSRLRKITGIRKIGHAGTLDPFATGLLIVAVKREATKTIDSIVKKRKTYLATIAIGATSETLDTETPEIRDTLIPPITDNDIDIQLSSLTGDLLQIPPMYSAIKINGKKLYELARKGEIIEIKSRPITIYDFSLTEKPIREASGIITISAHIDCSSGTYIRALARDLGASLHTSGYLRSLRRLTIGDVSVSDAITLDELTPENWKNHLHPLSS